MITNQETKTRIWEIAPAIYQIHTPFAGLPGGFSFNQYLVAADEPLLFHTGTRGLFPVVRQAIEAVMPIARLRYLGLSHYEADECGAMNSFLALAPHAVPLCGEVAAMTSIADQAERPPRVLKDGETLALGGRHAVRWLDTPHLPHGWECGFLFESGTRTLLCGDLFTQGGADHPPLTRTDILEPSEDFRKPMDYFSGTRNVRTLIDKLAATKPATLACMHGAAWEGDGAALLRALGDRLAA